MVDTRTTDGNIETTKIPEGFKPYRKITIIHAKRQDKEFETNTMEGKLKGKTGDYLVIGVEGETYPCDKDIFERTYEAVGDKPRPIGPIGGYDKIEPRPPHARQHL